MDFATIMYIIAAVGGFVVAAIPLICSLIAVIKKKIKLNKQLDATTDEAERAKLEAENAQATVDMTNVLGELIQNAEELYADVALQLKASGKTAGAVKKDSVMSKLQAYALSKGYDFDEQYWSDRVDTTVALTKKVNAA